MYGIKGARRNGNMGAGSADDTAVADAIGWPSISLCDVRASECCLACTANFRLLN